MKRLTVRSYRIGATSALCLAAVLRMHAQAAAPAADTSNSESDKTVVLSPFVVEASEDSGYSAKSTLAGTRVRMDMKDVASAISVVTTQFLKDTGATNNQSLLTYTPSTEVAGIRGNFSGLAGTAIYQENTIAPPTRVRGLDDADNTRDYFLTDIPWDSYNVGRLDLQRGPNSILFGTGSPAGIINASTNDASFKNEYNFENRVDRWGSLRDSINLNQELIKGVLAIRVSALKNDQLFEQKPAYNNDSRYYAAIRFDPQLFGEANHTTIRAKYESGKVDSNNPRYQPPVDEITPWFKSGVDANGNYGLNKLTINQFSGANLGPDGNYYPGNAGSVFAFSTFQLGGWAETRSYWPDVLNYYEGAGSGTSGTPIKTITAQPNTGLVNGVTNALNGLQNPNIFRPYGIAPYSNYAANIGFEGGNGPAYPQHTVPGGAYYADTVITDPSIFNFYKNLLDGPNKHESQNWKAFNLAIEQGFFDDRLAIQFAYDRQHYTASALQWLNTQNYAITVDVNQTYADGSPNPNVGRPYVGNAASSPGLNYTRDNLRETYRFTVTGELRPEDFFGKGLVTDIIGHQNLTGLFDHEQRTLNTVNFAEYATTPSYETDNSNQAALATSVNALASGREFDWLDYLGPSLANASSAAGANLNNISYVIQPPRNQFVRNFNATWNQPNYGWNALPSTFVKQGNGDYSDGTTTIPSGAIVNLGNGLVGATWNHNGQDTNPAAWTPYYKNPVAPPGGYVDPTAPWVFTNQLGQTQYSDNIANPANFVGWTQEPITWMSASNPQEFPDLVESATRTRYRDISKAFVWTGHFLDGDLVPSFGWRKDSITAYQTNAGTDQTTGFTSLNFIDNLASRTDVTGTSRSWGLVYHLPKKLMQKLPGGLDITLHFNRGENFKADATRLDFEGNVLPNAFGKTKEFGFSVSALEDKLTLKVDWFKTNVANATLADTEGNSIAGLGSNAYFIADGAIWGYAWATTLQDGLVNGQVPGTYGGYWDYAVNDGFTRNSPSDIAAANNYNLNGGVSPNGTHFIGGNAIVQAWVDAGKPGGVFPANYFASYNLSPAIDATKGSQTGLLRNSYINGYDDSGGPNTGGGSQFGNHQVTVDNQSKGVEIELVGSPTKNWNVSINYSHVNAIHNAIDAGAQKFIGDMTAFMNGPGGQVREWYNGGGSLGSQWDSSVVSQFTVELNGLGHAAPEVAPWRLNLVSSYTFDQGVLKGVNVGGALRVEAGKIIGYHFDPTFVNVNSSDPRYAVNLVPQEAGLTQGGLNVNEPFIGPNDHHVDMWVGYTHKFSRNLTWRIQLNLLSVGEKDKLVASRLQPDGSLALARIQEGMGWQVTNSFDF